MSARPLLEPNPSTVSLMDSFVSAVGLSVEIVASCSKTQSDVHLSWSPERRKSNYEEITEYQILT